MIRFFVFVLVVSALLVLLAGCYVPMASGPSGCGTYTTCPQFHGTRFAEPQYPFLDRNGTPRLRGEAAFRDRVRDWTNHNPPSP